MTSLLGRLLPLFIGPQRIEDLFTEAVARLFERRPELCLSWLDELGLITLASEEEHRYISVNTQKSFVALEEHSMGSRPGLIVEIHHPVEDAESESPKDVVMIESKIGSWEGQEQLKRFAEHLDKRTGMRKTLVYITRAYDPKEKEEILTKTQGVEFRQLRWHDFYTFLQKVETDALVEEVMLFMEEQGMARSHRLSTTDLMALSGVPRAFEIFDETLGDEVRSELESFAGHRIRREAVGLNHLRRFNYYLILAPLHESESLRAHLGYDLWPENGYPEATISLQTKPKAVNRELSIAAMKQISVNRGWQLEGIDDLDTWSRVSRAKSLAEFLVEEDHIAAIKQFFVESIQQLQEELTEFKKENPELPWESR